MASKFIEDIQASDMSISCLTYDRTPYHVADNNLPMDGVIRTNQGGLEYYDANSQCWLNLSGTEVKLELGSVARAVLDWAYDKMLEEQKLSELVEKYPSLREAKQNYDIIKAMVENEVD